MDFGKVLTKEFLLSWEGRTNRAQVWALFLLSLGAGIVLGIVDGIIGTGGFLGGLLGLALIYPSICVAIKRWHDRDKSGWWILIAFVPVIGWIWYFVEVYCLKGTDGPNRFGPDPLAAA